MLLGQESGNKKYPYFSCLWGSREIVVIITKKKFGQKKMSLERGSSEVINDPLVGLLKVLLPSLHIKLGLTKQVVKALHNIKG